MVKLDKVTFTGVDEFTDLDRLQFLQQRYPFAEFGILFSKNYAENGNRYPNPEILNKLVDRNLHLSAHLCGKLAVDTYEGNFETLLGVIPWINENAKIRMLFDRIQLNLAGYDGYEFRKKTNPENYPLVFNDLIIQQKSANNCDIYERNKNNYQISMLCDPSGGEGIESDFIIYKLSHKGKIGYAGGIGEHNIIDKLNQLESATYYPYWIDMESKVRIDSKFDLDTVERILENVAMWRRYK